MKISTGEAEIRVLGSLMEKALATPDYYPLSLNALAGACNQKSNRDPVVAYDEGEVENAAGSLIRSNLVQKNIVGRVPKYEELLSSQNDFVPRESAVLCVLLLRGPQTPGAIRSRTSRLCAFDSLDEVIETLDNLSEWGFVQQLPRLPGHKESRYSHLLSEGAEAPPAGESRENVQEKSPVAAPGKTDEDADRRMEKLEEEVAALSKELRELKTAFTIFKKQFED